jgi:DNA-directed RNA polymerase alpha subunit
MGLLPKTLSVRCRYSLAAVGIITIGDLQSVTLDELLDIRNFSTLNLIELMEAGLYPDHKWDYPNWYEI